MEKIMIEKYSPMQLFPLTLFKAKGDSSMQLLPQMPSRQLAHFLNQAMEKKLPVTVQLNPSSKKDNVRECSGIPRVSSRSEQFFLLEDKKTVYLCPFDSVRHVRAVN